MERIIIFAAVIVIAEFIADLITALVQLVGDNSGHAVHVRMSDDDDNVIYTYLDDDNDLYEALDDLHLDTVSEVYVEYIPEIVPAETLDDVFVVQNKAKGELFRGREAECMTFLTAYSVAMEHLLTTENVSLEDIIAAATPSDD